VWAGQESWPYDEPPDFHLPVRQCLGQLQLQLGDYVGAYTSFTLDLSRFIDNGWSLYGLLRALEQHPAVPDPPTVASVKARLQAAWQRADVPLQSSCLSVSLNL
jgi:hypothetical protein